MNWETLNFRDFLKKIEEEEFDGFNEIVSETGLISTNNEEHDDVASPKKVVISNCIGEQKYTFVGNQVVSDELGDLELFEKMNKVEFEIINEITSERELMSPYNEEHDEVAIVKKVVTNKGECSICLEKFGETLRKHNIKHHTVSSLYVHPCDHCSKWFPSLEVLEEHEANHSKDKDRKEELPSLETDECPICLAIIVGSYIRQHRRKFHTVSSLDVLPCDHCTEWFPSLADLTEHESFHNMDKDPTKLYCNFCSYSCLSKCGSRSQGNLSRLKGIFFFFII